MPICAFWLRRCIFNGCWIADIDPHRWKMQKKTMAPKQEAFIREYLVDLNASAAYVRAGYKTGNANVNGPRLLANAGIKEAIQKAMDERAKRVDITAETVLKNIIEIGQRCMQKAPVMVGHGKDRKQAITLAKDPETGEECLAAVWEFDAQGALRAQELLGKHLKMFTDKVVLSNPDGTGLFGKIERVVIHARK